jgi:hypothetical protein
VQWCGGLPAVAAFATGLVLVVLEGPHLPLLRVVDARRLSPRFRSDEALYHDDDTAVLSDAASGRVIAERGV